MLKDQGINERIFNEMMQVSKLDFDFEEEADPIENVKWLSKQMIIYPSQLINTVSITYEFSPEIISSYQNLLKPENVCIVLTSRDFSKECHLVEPLYKTNYLSEDIPSLWENQWQNL